MKKKSSGFSGSLGFVLAAAGSAVGVGNIWRFPYLCAKDGGGLFLVVYLVLVLTFGFVLLTTDVAIGRRTKLNALNAYAALGKKWRFLGFLTFLVPALIMTYYSVIGGWILKYLTAYLTTDGSAPAQDGYFTGFITAPVAPIVFTLVFLAFTAFVVYCGVEKGIERYSRILMPGLLLLIVGGVNHFVTLGRWAKVVLEAVLKVGIFLTYMVGISKMKEIHRVFEYHGAEHKTIACYEAGDPLTVENVRKYTRFHPRCGTSFLILVVIVSVFLYSVLPWGSIGLRVVCKLLLLPLVMGISYELLKWCGRSDNIATRIIRQPGIWVQHLTVFEPDDSMIEVAIAAITPVLPENPEEGKW